MDMVDKIKSVEEWQKLAREKLAPNVTYTDKKFAKVASWAQELLNAFWVEQQKDLDDFLTTLLTQRDQQLLDAVVSVLEGLEIVSKPELKMVNPHIQTWEDGYRFALDDAKSAIKNLLDVN